MCQNKWYRAMAISREISGEKFCVCWNVRHEMSFSKFDLTFRHWKEFYKSDPRMIEVGDDFIKWLIAEPVRQAIGSGEFEVIGHSTTT